MEPECYFTKAKKNLKTIPIKKDNCFVGHIFVSKDLEISSIEYKDLKKSYVYICSSKFREKIDYYNRPAITIGFYESENPRDSLYNNILIQFIKPNFGWECVSNNIKAIECGAIIGERGYYWVHKNDDGLIRYNISN